jgi:hypothetical protein
VIPRPHAEVERVLPVNGLWSFLAHGFTGLIGLPIHGKWWANASNSLSDTQPA